MTDAFTKAIRQNAGGGPGEEEQKALGRPTAVSFDDEHASFMKTVISLIDAGTIDTKSPMSFLNLAIYNHISPELHAKTDQALPNISSLLERIMDLHARPEKNESFEMQNLIESLWQVKERIEKEADVFVF